MTYSGYITALKHMRAKPFLWKCAQAYNLKLEITDHDKGWWLETIYYTMDGDELDIQLFEKELEAQRSTK